MPLSRRYRTLVSYKKLEDLLGVPIQEIEELLSKYSATKGHIFASTIWQLVIAGAEMEKSAITELEKQFQEARGKKNGEST